MLRRLAISISCAFVLAQAAMAIAAPAEQAPDASLAPFLGKETWVVMAIDLADAGNTAALRGLCQEGAGGPGAWQGLSEALLKTIVMANAGNTETQFREVDSPRRVYLVVSWFDALRLFSTPLPPDRAERDNPVVVIVPGLNPETIQKLSQRFSAAHQSDDFVCREMHSLAVFGSARSLERLKTVEAVPRPDLMQALAAAGEWPIRIGIGAHPQFARAAKEILISTPANGDRPLGSYLAGFQAAWLGTSLGRTEKSGKLVIRFSQLDAADAKELGNIVQKSPILFELFDSSDKESVKVEGDRIELKLSNLGEQLAEAEVRADVTRERNRLTQIMLALQNYHDVHKAFPDVAFRDPDGKPLLSWRVAILPFLNEQALYKQFHLDEPWDSPHNRQLVSKIPAAYRSNRSAEGKTRFLAPLGEKLAFVPDPKMIPPREKKQNAGKEVASTGLKIKDFTDGVSKTIQVVEVEPDHAVPWTKPEDLVVDLDHPQRGLTDGKADFFAGLVDASVHRIKGSISAELLRAMLTRDGGEIFDVKDAESR